MTPLSLIFGALVGFSLGLTGGGGAIFAVPLLVYGLGVPPRDAVGISLATVGLTALVGFAQRWRMGLVELHTGLLFAAAGMLSAPVGAWLAALAPPALLLTLFALLMLAIAIRMWRRAVPPVQTLIPEAGRGAPTCRRDETGELRLNSRCGMLLAGVGLGSGLLTGLFGVGGGFIIVPALVTFSGMSIQRAVGTSLLVIALVSLSGIGGFLATGRDLPLEMVWLFAAGGIGGLFAGAYLAQRLAGPRLQRVFAAAIVLVAAFVLAKSVWI